MFQPQNRHTIEEHHQIANTETSTMAMKNFTRIDFKDENWIVRKKIHAKYNMLWCRIKILENKDVTKYEEVIKDPNG